MEFTKYLLEYETGKTPIRLLLQKQSDLGLPCLSRPLFWQATSFQNLRMFTILVLRMHVINIDFSLTLMTICFVSKMLSAYYICCIYSSAFQTNFITKPNTMNPQKEQKKEQKTIVVNSKKMVKMNTLISVAPDVMLEYYSHKMSILISHPGIFRD